MVEGKKGVIMLENLWLTEKKVFFVKKIIQLALDIEKLDLWPRVQKYTAESKQVKLCRRNAVVN